MSWKGGVRLAHSIIETLLEHVDDDEARFNIYRDLIEILENMDCDNLSDLYDATDDKAFDDAFCDTHPDSSACSLIDEDEDYE